MIGGFVQGYRIVKVLGSGAMGIVYLGEHKHIGRKAAVKLLRPELSSRPELVNRFFDEARAAGLVDHPGVVQVFDCDIHGETGHAFIIMELLEGVSLRDRLVDTGAVSAPEAARVIRDAADILRAVHQVGIVHRDLKPDNVFLLSRSPPGAPSVKILDFGIAKLSAELHGRHTGTLEGSLLGTPTYMSPEQCRGALDIDARTDVYALGCMLFELLAGRPPFLGDALGALISSHLTVVPPLLADLGCQAPPAVQELVARMLSKQPSERPTIPEIIEGLDAHAGPATRTRLLPPEISSPIAVASERSAGFTPVSTPASGETDHSERMPLQPAAPSTITTLSGAASPVQDRSGAHTPARGATASLARAIGIAAGLVAIAAVILVVSHARAPRRADPAAGAVEPGSGSAAQPPVEREVAPVETSAATPSSLKNDLSVGGSDAGSEAPSIATQSPGRVNGANHTAPGRSITKNASGPSRRTEPSISRRSVRPSGNDRLPIE
jgi:serine/threonine protein kinase